MNKINISINYITNFKPSKNFSEGYTFLKNKNNIILCKHFIVFFYLMKFILKKNSSLRIFFKPRRRKIETLLRPPYRHKISRHQITLSRYLLVVSFYTKLNNAVCLSNNNQLFFIISEISKSFNFFETNICYTNSIKIKIPFYFNNFFKLMNYK